MAKEDIIKKDIVNELKDIQEENDQSHLEPVNVVIGRYQPFTIGHLGMAKELEKINGLPSVYIYIRSKSGKNSKFSERLTVNYMEDVVKGQDLVKDAYPMTASFIPIVIKETQRRGYNPVLIGAGEDRAKSYASMAKRMKDITVHPDFKIQELKGRLTSATEVRQAIMDDDKKKFMKLTPKQVHPYYKQLKDELEKAGAVVESLTVDTVLDGFDVSIDEAERILESYGEDFFSDSLIIESILDYELNELKSKMNSGTSAGTTEELEDKKYELTKDIKGVQAGNRIITLPKGTIVSNLPGGVFVKHDKLSRLERELGRGNYGIMIRQMPDILGQIEANSKILESMEINENKIAKAFKFIKKKLGLTKVVSPTDEQFKYAKEWLQKKQKTDKVELNGIGVDTVQDVIHVSYNAGPYLEVETTIPLPEELQESEKIEEAKIKFKEDYPVYHDTYGSALDSIMRYVESSGNKIEQQEFFGAFGDAFFKPKKGKTQRKTVEIEDKNGKLVGHLHVQIYNRGTDGNTYELNMYSDGVRRGLKENAELNEGNVQVSRRNFLKMIHPLKVYIKNNYKAQEELYELIKEFYGDHGVTVFEMLMDTHHNALLKSHTRIFEKALMFRTGEVHLDEKEKEFIPFLAKLDETKLEKFKNALNEMVSPEYEAKIDQALAMMINTNRPVVWEDFKSQMMRSEFFKKDFRPFLMMQGLNDHQIDRMVENILRVKYQHYTNYYLGTVALQYEIK